MLVNMASVIYTHRGVSQLPELYLHLTLSQWFWQKTKKSSWETGKTWLEGYWDRDIVNWLWIQNKTLLFNVQSEICQNTETHFHWLLFYQNQTKWDCWKLCIVLVIACAICTVILSDGFLLLSKGYVKCPECLRILWIFFLKHAFLLTNRKNRNYIRT